MSDIKLAPVVDEGLGNSAYLLTLEDGRALAVDPPRDLRAVRAVAHRRGLRIAYACDTHLHADFLTGARQLAATDGAALLASAAGGRDYPYRGLDDGDEVDLGGLRLRVLATPGHTGEHVAYLLLDGDRPQGVFTGGSLLVGSAARTDLLGADRTVELARAQHRSLQRLLELPDPTAVWPTHGAGSFCSAPPGADRTSTIGRERASNPFAGLDEDAFVDRLLASLGSYPPYFLRLSEVNRRGPAVLADEPGLASLSAVQVRRRLADGAELLDVRPVKDYAAAHVPGALSIPLRGAFATWLGWLAPADRPLVILRNADQAPAGIVWQALNIGYDNLAGELTGGVPAWIAAGGETTSTGLARPDQLSGHDVLDVRQATEWTAGHLPAARHVELGDLLGAGSDDPITGTVVMCGHGERAASAASLLERAGHRDLAILVGGPHDWSAATGQQLETGP